MYYSHKALIKLIAYVEINKKKEAVCKASY